MVLFDSPVICEYSTQGTRAQTVPAKAARRRFKALRLRPWATASRRRTIGGYEMRWPENLRWAEWLDGQKRKVAQGLDALERKWPT